MIKLRGLNEITTVGALLSTETLNSFTLYILFYKLSVSLFLFMHREEVGKSLQQTLQKQINLKSMKNCNKRFP